MDGVRKRRLSFRIECSIFPDKLDDLEATMSVTTHGMLTECQVRSGLSSAHHDGLLARLGDLVGTWRRRSKERRAFAQLDNRDLRDIGLSQWEVETELAKPFWRE
jgi:uncharacterized protein YjiS (DUF1127 family)